MGRKLPPQVLKSDKFSSVSLGIVIIPEEQHRLQCNKRRNELRNFIPFFNHWTTDFTRIQELRVKMRQYAESHGIPVFDSFESAANKLAGNNVVKRD
jgi:2-phosphoglycerate kinase